MSASPRERPLVVLVSLKDQQLGSLVAYRYADETVDDIRRQLRESGIPAATVDPFTKRLALSEVRAWIGTVSKDGDVTEASKPSLGFLTEDGAMGFTLRDPDGSVICGWSVAIADEHDQPIALGADYAGDVVFTLTDGHRTWTLPIAVRIRKAFTPGRMETSGTAAVGACTLKAPPSDT